MTFPDRDNIDKWFFDFHEGNLSERQSDMLFAFLEDHPDLQEEFEAWEDAKMAPQEIHDFHFDRIHLLQKRESSLLPKVVLLCFGIVICSLLFVGVEGNQKTTQSAQGEIPILAASEGEQSSKNATQNTSQKKKNSYTNSRNRTVNNNSDVASNISAKTLPKPTNTRLSRNSNTENIFGASNKPTNPIQFESKSIVSSYVEEEIISNLSETEAHNNFSENSTNYTQKSKLPSNCLQEMRLNTLLEDESNYEGEIGYLSDNHKDASGIALHVKLPKWIDNLGKRDIGLNYVPDQLYALPEISQADVQFSNTGAVSQFRVRTSSIGRRLEDPKNQLLSNQINIDGYSRATRLGVGFQMNYDRFGNGIFSNYDAALVLSPKIAMTKKVSFEPAVRIRFGNYHLNTSKIDSYNNTSVEFQSGIIQTVSFDTAHTPGNNLLYQDIDLGFTLNSSKFYLGVQANNLTRHFNDIFSNTENNYERAHRTISAVTGTQFLSNNRKLSFSPYLFFQHANSELQKFVGFSSSIYGLSLGASYSDKDRFTALLGFTGKKMSLHALSTVGKDQNGSLHFIHQLGLRFNNLTSKKERRYITL